MKHVKNFFLIIFGFWLFAKYSDLFAATSAGGIGDVAASATTSLKNIAKLITGACYVAGLGFAVGAIVKFKGHKDNPTQVPISMPITLLFMGAALIFAPSVFNTVGGTMFGASGSAAGPSGMSDFTKGS